MCNIKVTPVAAYLPYPVAKQLVLKVAAACYRHWKLQNVLHYILPLSKQLVTILHLLQLIMAHFSKKKNMRKP